MSQDNNCKYSNEVKNNIETYIKSLLRQQDNTIYKYSDIFQLVYIPQDSVGGKFKRRTLKMK